MKYWHIYLNNIILIILYIKYTLNIIHITNIKNIKDTYIYKKKRTYRFIKKSWYFKFSIFCFDNFYNIERIEYCCINSIILQLCQRYDFRKIKGKYRNFFQISKLLHWSITSYTFSITFLLQFSLYFIINRNTHIIRSQNLYSIYLLK